MLFSMTARRRCVIATLVLAEVAIWVNSTDSAIVKQPLGVLGASLAATFFIAETLTRRRLEFSFSLLGILVALHLGLFVASAAYRYDPVYTWGALGLAFSCILFYSAGASLFPTQREIHVLFNVLEAVTTLLCIAALLQLLLPSILPLEFGAGADSRLSSLLGNSSYFSAYLVLVFPVVLGRILFEPSGRGLKILRLLELVMIALALAAAQTRGSMLACVVSLWAFFLLVSTSRRNRRYLLFSGLACIGAVLCVIAVRPDYGQRWMGMLGEPRGTTLSRRITFWKAGKEAFLASPIFGHGIGSFEREVYAYRSPDYWEVGAEDVVPHAHNEIIEVATEYGCVGLLLLSATLCLLFREALRSRRATDAQERWIAAAVAASLCAIAVDNLVGVSLRQAPVALLAWLLMGLLASRTSAMKLHFSIPLTLPPVTVIVPACIWIVLGSWYVSVQARAIASDMHLFKAFMASESDAHAEIAEFQAAVAEKPTNLFARSEMARAFVRLGRWDDALRCAHELQQLAPLYPKSSLVRAYALLCLGDYRGASEAIRRELLLRAHPEGYLIQAGACRGLHDVPGEREALTLLLRKDIEANIAYDYRSSCERLVKLSTTEDERQECSSLLMALESIVPQDRAFFRRLTTKLQERPELPSAPTHQ